MSTDWIAVLILLGAITTGTALGGLLSQWLGARLSKRDPEQLSGVVAEVERLSRWREEAHRNRR